MSFDALEQSGSSSQPYELYLFQGTGFMYALTSAELELTYLGNVYQPTSITRSEVEQSDEVVSGQIKVYIPKDHPLAASLIPYLPSSPVAVTIFASHYNDTETVVLFTGTIASARFTDQCEITCNSQQYLLQRKIPVQLYQSPCSHIFGDEQCGVPLTAHTYDGTITAIDPTGTILTIPAFVSCPDPLTGGFLKVGNDSRMIVTASGATITILAAIPGLQAGDAVQGTAGCALTFAACNAYKNSANFLGFDLIPTVNPFDGSASIG